jgi:hypothetical protein
VVLEIVDAQLRKAASEEGSQDVVQPPSWREWNAR